MIRLIFSADQHLGATHMTTLADQVAALDAVIDAANGADALLLGGDATHWPRPHPTVLAAWGRALARCRVPVVAIAGNETHDGPDVLRVMEQFRGAVQVATEPRIITIQHEGVGFVSDLVDVACLPWLPDAYVRASSGGTRSKEETAAALTAAARAICAGFLAQRRPGIPMILLTHATIAGAETSGGFNMGYHPSTYYVIPVENVAGFDMVLAGHLHRHQALMPNVVYSGSLLPLDFSETEPKGYLDVVLEPLDDVRPWMHVPVPSPRVLTIRVGSRADLERLAFAAPEVLPVDDALVRVQMTVDEETARLMPPARIREYLLAAGARMVQVDLAVTHADRARDTGATADLTPIAAFQRYMDAKTDLAPELIERIREHAAVVVADAGIHRAMAHGDQDLTITAIEAVNFLGVGEATLDLTGGGVTALTGPVGSGKSTIGADAPRFTLFGTHRGGARPSEHVIRAGSDHAMTAVTLRSADGGRYRIVRQVRRGAQGRVSSTVDVMQGQDGAWAPLRASSTLRDARDAVDAILGGLDDATLTASSIVIQRAADLFTRADPTDRRALLARAAGLSIYDELAAETRTRAVAADRAYDTAVAAATPLRTCVAGIPALEQEHALALAEQQATVDALAAAERELAAAIDAGPDDVIGQRIQATQARIDELEAGLADIATALERRTVIESQIRVRRDRLTAMQNRRASDARNAATLMAEVERAQAKLAAAACCAPEPSCVFVDDARMVIKGRPTIERLVVHTAEPSDDEVQMAAEIAGIVVPDVADSGLTRNALSVARATLREYQAQQAARVNDARTHVDALRRTATAAAARAEHLSGRLTELRAAQAALDDADRAVELRAFDAMSWRELVTAWGACRVAVLETSVIPSVERVANDILRRFPYGIQVALVTQRTARAGNMIETLDVNVLGGHGPLYEMCSGGERTCIDFAFHVAIAIVVSRRATSRLRYLFADEPEGLDEPGRVAFAQIARWIHDTYDVTVVVSSHAPDLIDALGGRRVDVVPGPDGSRAVPA